MSASELQEEELEALDAIFEDDENYEKKSDTEIQYKIKSEDGDTNKNFLIEFTWPEEYPEVKPTMSLKSFFNIHLNEATKNSIIAALEEEAENNIGMSMTYTIIEFAKENQDKIAAFQKEREVIVKEETAEIKSKKPKEQKEQLSKRQKARQVSRLVDGELPRGYDWVCLIRHLSQTGGAEQQS